MSWFSRLFTLPKSKNSVSDIFGSDYAEIFRRALWPIADEVAAQTVDVLSKGLVTAAGIVDRTKRDWIFRLQGLIGKPLAEKVQDEIDAALQGALAKLPKDDAEMQRVIRDALLKAIKL